jgi:DNA gyrase inhibitor GyrI
MGWMGPDTVQVSLYLDNPEKTPEEQLRSYAAISEPAHFTPHDGIRNMDIGGGRYLVGRYVGAYTGLHQAWREMEQYVGGHIVRTDADEFEVYVVHDDQHPENCVTDLYVPIE